MGDTATMGLEPPAPGLWRNRDWRLLFTSQAISLVGDFVFDVTVVLWVATVIAKNQTWAPMAVAGALIAAAAPVMLIGPFVGVFVDRWDRRRTMIVADLVRAVLIASLLALPILGDRLSVALQLTIVYSVVALTSATAQFFNVARFAILARVVAESDQPRASGATQMTTALASIIGPPLAAPLLFSVGVELALAVNAFSFVISLVAIVAMSRAANLADEGESGQDVRGFWREFAEGATFFGRNRILRAIMVCVVIATLGVTAINALDVFFVTENLHAPPAALGTLSAAFGVGLVIGALIATAVGRRVRSETLFWVMLTIAGIGVVAYARASDLGVATAILAGCGIPLAIVNTVAGPIMLKVTPQRLLGRVMAVFNPIQQFATIAGMAVASYLASTVLHGLDVTVAGVHFGRIDSLFLIGGLLVCAAGLWAAIAMRGSDSLNSAAALSTEPNAPDLSVPGSSASDLSGPGSGALEPNGSQGRGLDDQVKQLVGDRAV